MHGGRGSVVRRDSPLRWLMDGAFIAGIVLGVAYASALGVVTLVTRLFGW